MTSNNPGNDTIAGVAIAVGAVSSVLLMAWHPTTSAHDLADVVAEIASESGTTRVVHAGMIVAMWTLLFGLLEFAAGLGWKLARARFGAIFYGAGVLSLTGAALVNGFVVPAFAARYVGSTAADLAAVGPVLRVCFESNQALAAAGVIAVSAGIVFWSSVMIGTARGGSAIGVLGFAVGALPVIGLLTGHLRLHLHGMAAVVVAQAVWNVAVSVRLVLGAPASEPMPD